MELFHYTNRTAAESILREGIRVSGRPHPGQDYGADIDAVSLTTSRSADGHGLSTGERLAGERLAILAKFQPKYAKYDLACFPDKTEVRLTVDIDDSDPKLVSWSEYCSRLNAPNHFKWSAEFAGLFSPGAEAFSFHEWKVVENKLREGVLKTQGATWWFYEGAVPKEWITKIEDRVVNSERMKSSSDIWLPHLAKRRFGLDRTLPCFERKSLNLFSFVSNYVRLITDLRMQCHPQ